MKTSIKRKRSGLMRLVANATLAYPLLFIGLLYGEYYLSWHYLGHPPLTNGNDDPACIDGSSWMYPLVAIALIGLYPTTPIALLSNIAYIVYYRPSAVQASIRLYTLVGFWLGVFVLIYRDPQKVMVWWLD
jgi:hypothetical protein